MSPWELDRRTESILLTYGVHDLLIFPLFGEWGTLALRYVLCTNLQTSSSSSSSSTKLRVPQDRRQALLYTLSRAKLR